MGFNFAFRSSGRFVLALVVVLAFIAGNCLCCKSLFVEAGRLENQSSQTKHSCYPNKEGGSKDSSHCPVCIHLPGSDPWLLVADVSGLSNYKLLVDNFLYLETFRVRVSFFTKLITFTPSITTSIHFLFNASSPRGPPFRFL